ncbi:MAG: DUF4124 domain-containing protein [Caulobacter sp.]|nr:DUF4124 domain-containing protein [Vitreoscilla sp.]
MPNANFAFPLLAALPFAAQAQVYKCAQPTGGTTYQSTPCPVAAKPVPHPTAAQLNAERASAPKPAGPPMAVADPYDDGHRRRHCTVARENTITLKRTGGRVFITNTAGQREYIDDHDRPRLLAEAEKHVAKFCD